MAKERLWTLGNREPTKMAYDLEIARRKAGAHTKATPEAWQDFVALFKLLPEAISRLIVLESERDEMHSRLRIAPPPENVARHEEQPYCEDEIAGPLGVTAHDALMKGWARETVYESMIAYGHYMIAFDRRNLGLNREYKYSGPKAAAEAQAKAEAEGFFDVPPYGTRHWTDGGGC